MIEGNLVASTLATSAGLRGDTQPASFWAHTPANFWRHNIAAGSDSSGFWFELSSSPGGPSYTPDLCPVTHQLGEFHNNTAHSSPFGFRIYPEWTPLVTECGRTDDLADAAPQVLTNSTVHHISDRGVFWKSAGAVQLANWAFIANSNFDMRVFVVHVPPPVAWIPHLVGALFVCDPAGWTACPTMRPASLHLPHTEDFLIEGASWWGYGIVPAMLTCNICADVTKPLINAALTYRMSGLSMVDTDSWVTFGPPQKEILWDLDGTLTGLGGNSFVVMPRGYNAWPECASGGALFGGAQVCKPNSEVRKMHVAAPATSALDYTLLNISSAVGWDVIQFIPGTDWVGWAVPVVARHGPYNLSWVGYGGDWTQLRFRWSEPEYSPANGPDFTVAQVTAPTPRYSSKVSYAGDLTARPVVRPPLDGNANAIGTCTAASADNRTWAFMLNARGENVATGTLPTSGVQFDAFAVFCPPAGCTPPPPPSALGNNTLWSSPTSWPNGVLPAFGDDVVIAANASVLFDVQSTPPLNSLTIYGSLTFVDGAGPRQLTVGTLTVWGSLTIGTPAAPFLAPAEIVFAGDFSGPQGAIDTNTVGGNKGLIVLGKVVIAGSTSNATWIRLNTSATAGVSSISLATAASGEWAIGDVIVLGSTSYDVSETEVATIAAISSDRLTFNLTTPLAFTHFAGPAGVTPVAAGVVLAGAVGRLSRSIVLRGNLSSPTDDYGFHVLITSTTTGGGRSGSLYARGVELRDCGKYVNDHACVRAQFGGWPLSPAVPANAPPVVLDGVSMHNALYYGLQALAAPGIIIRNSVLFGGTPNVIDLDSASQNATLVNNLVVGPYMRPAKYTVGQLVWFRSTSAFALTAPHPGVVTGNVVQGAYDVAYTFFPDSCATATPQVYNNEAVSARTGIFVLAAPGTSPPCIQLSGFTMWAIAHAAITGIDLLSSVVVTGAIIADSHIGIVLNPVLVDPVSLQTITVQYSVLMGTTAASGSLCTRNAICRAMSEYDPVGDTCGSALGPRYRRAGMLVPAFTSAAKTCGVNGILHPCRPLNTPVRACSMPWEKRYGVTGTAAIHTYLTNVSFVGFAGAEPSCGNVSAPASVAVVGNPSQVNHSPPFTLRGIIWEATPQSGKFDFTWGGQDPGNSAQLLLSASDADGSTTGVSGTTILGPDPALADSNCVYVASWPGYLCPSVMRGAFIESEDADVSTRILGTLVVTREPDPSANATWRAAGSMVPENEPCSEQDGASRYPIVLEVGLQTGLAFPAVEPGTFQLHFMSDDPAEGVVVAIHLQRRFTWNVFVDNVKVAATPPVTNAPIVPLPSDPVGTNAYDPNAKTMWITLRGGNHLYNLIRTPAVQVTLALSMSYNNFYVNDFVHNMALLLGLPPWRISVVNVEPLSSRRQRRLAPGETGSHGRGIITYGTDGSWAWRAAGPIPNAVLHYSGASDSGVSVQFNVLDILANTTVKPLNASNATDLANAQQQAGRLANLSSSIANLTASGGLDKIGNATVSSVAVAPLPPPPVAPPAKPAFVALVTDIVGGVRTNGTQLSGNDTVIGLIDPSSTPAPTPQSTHSTSQTPTTTPSSTISPTVTSTAAPTPSSTKTSYMYNRGTGQGPPQYSLIAWLRPDQLVNGSSLTSWHNAMADSRTSGTAVPSAAVALPTFAAPVVAIDNATGLAVATFAAASHAALLLNVSKLASVPSWSIFYVVKLAGPHYGRILTDAATGTWSLGASAGRGDLVVTPAGAHAGALTLPTSTRPLASTLRNKWTLYGLVREADGNGYFFRNGVRLAIGAVASPPGGALALGGTTTPGSTTSSFSDCAIGDLLVYTTGLGQATYAANVSRFDVEGSLAHKYGIALPAWHPFYVPPTPSSTATGSRTAPPSLSATHSPTHSLTSSRTSTRTSTTTRSSTASPSGALSATRSETGTHTPTRTDTNTESSTRSATSSHSPTRTSTQTSSSTRSPTGSPSPTRSAAATQTPTHSTTASLSATRSASISLSSTHSLTQSRSSSRGMSGTQTSSRALP